MQETTELAYDTAMAQVERGQIVVCVPGEDEHGSFVLTAWHPLVATARPYVFADENNVRAAYLAATAQVTHRKLVT